MSFTSFALDSRLLSTVSALGYKEPTPVQTSCIPLVLSGKDVLAAAQTGTGKTAAFVLPLLTLLAKEPKPVNFLHARALVLTPTRELAQQVYESVERYGASLGLKAAVFYGGVSLRPQYDAAERGLDILVATPGRLLDHLHQGTVNVSELHYLVLDEADRMLDMGFLPDIERILKKLPAKRQTLFFSATFSKSVKAFAANLLHEPALVEVARANSTAAQVEQWVYLVDSQRKRELLSYLIGSKQWTQVLVFCRTREGAEKLSKQLRLDGLEAGAIHGDKSQGARLKALADFKNNKLGVLVATDVAARGLDIEQLPVVVNYDLPHDAEDYVHRIGRTGRAGLTGLALSLVTSSDLPMLRSIEKLTRQILEPKVLPGYEHDPRLNHRSTSSSQEYSVKKKPASRNKELSKEKAKLRAKALGKKG